MINFIIWILAGGLIGWVASLIEKAEPLMMTVQGETITEPFFSVPSRNGQEQ